MVNRGSNRREQPGGWGESITMWVGIGAVVAVLAIVYVGARLGHQLAGIAPAPSGPWEVFFGVLGGDVAWPAESTYVAIAATVLVALLGGLAWVVWSRRKGKRSRVDWTARYLGRGREVQGITEKTARAKADRWGMDSSARPGVLLGRAVSDGRRLYGSYEDELVLVAGPRMGKTLCYAVPTVVDAPGAVLATSNKRDLVDATRDVRAAQHGEDRVFVFDPQQVANEPATWWWNPLSYVTDEVTASNLADHFAASLGDSSSGGDNRFFEVGGRDILAALFLAAAAAELPITQVFTWTTLPDERRPVEILRAHDYPLQADQLEGVIGAAEEQRSGLYGTAQNLARPLTNRALAAWITDDGRRRPQFDPHEFVRYGGTLYSLSQEGRGSAGALVTALTVAVVEAAEELAKTQPGGRLSTPLVGVLDEAANVCRWGELPNLYSHYGSRGIVLLTILQNKDQAEEVWGKRGWGKLRAAANDHIYAGGVDDTEYLEDVAKIVGSYDKLTRSVSARGTASMWGNGVQTSQQLTRERILDVEDLGALPPGYAVVMSSGNRPTLVHTVGWPDGPHADAIRASIKAHDPGARATLDLVERDTTVVHVAQTEGLR